MVTNSTNHSNPPSSIYFLRKDHFATTLATETLINDETTHF